MTKVTTPEQNHSVVQSVSKGSVSLNSQVNGFKGNPNPSLMSLLSNGSINMSQLSTAISFSGYGGN